ncbi:MAG: hypothetical protein HYZ54_02295 [Ignavibacteriae bacterium]|nr:hypothetical protein [Ignavibacteriota bacterium]
MTNQLSVVNVYSPSHTSGLVYFKDAWKISLSLEVLALGNDDSSTSTSIGSSSLIFLDVLASVRLIYY